MTNSVVVNGDSLMSVALVALFRPGPRCDKLPHSRHWFLWLEFPRNLAA